MGVQIQMDSIIQCAIDNDVIKGSLLDLDKYVGAIQVPTSSHKAGERENGNLRLGEDVECGVFIDPLLEGGSQCKGWMNVLCNKFLVNIFGIFSKIRMKSIVMMAQKGESGEKWMGKEKY